MLLSLETPVVISLVALIAVQYAFATFCLMKLARLDLPRKNYVLWNLFILLVFIIGGTVFLIYYFKVKDKLTVPEYVPSEKDKQENENAVGADGEEQGAEKEAIGFEDIFEQEVSDNSVDTPEPKAEESDPPADGEEQ